MGLSIHYSGRLKDQASLPALITEVKDIVEIYKWEYFIFEDVFPEGHFGQEFYHPKNFYGILFSPPDCEPVYMSFLSNGRMSGPPLLEFWGNPETEAEAKYLYMLFTKTQFAGSEVHKLVIHLLRHLSQKYLLDFKLIDEGNYWETNDEALLDATFKRYTNLIDGFATSLEMLPLNEGENFMDYFQRLMEIVNKKYPDNPEG